MAKSRYSTDYKTLCQLLTEVRKECELTQSQLAENLQKPQSYVSKYEQGERRLDLVELTIILDQLGISLDDFVKRYQKELRSR